MKLRIVYLVVLILASLYLGLILGANHERNVWELVVADAVDPMLNGVYETQMKAWQMSLEYQKAVESRDAVIEWYKAQPPQIKETKVYLDKIVYQDVPTPIEIKDFQSLDEFYKEMPSYTYFTGGCLSIAEALQSAFLVNGYQVSLALTYNGYYYGQRVTDAPYGHAGLLVGIQGVYYFYDPESKELTRLF